ncbi:MAG: toxin-antitoxin system YwqK family antitoxin, partial [Bacteroidales bacterium]
LIIILALALAIALYLLFLRPEKAPLFEYVPESAFLMFYTDDFKETWEDFRETDTWTITSKQTFLDSSLKRISSLDSTIRKNKFINKILSDHSLLISLHPIEKEGLRPVFYLDLMELSKLRFSYDLFERKYLKESGFETRNKFSVDGEDVYEITKNDSRFFICILDNVLFMSTRRELVTEVIEGEENQWVKEESFIKLDNEYRKHRDIQLYINFSQINSVLETSELDPENYKLWVNPLQYGVYNIEIEDDFIQFTGGISAVPHSHGYLNAFCGVDIGRSDAFEIISKDIATYNAYNFNRFNNFNENFKAELAAIDDEAYSQYIETFDQIEKKFDIDIQEHVFNWIGKEIVLGKLKPTIGVSGMNDFFLAIRASNINTARTMLDIIIQKVSDKSPLKIREKSYRGHKIKYLDIKNFFKLFAGNLFEEMDRPYFAIIDDYVVFSNSVENLTTLLDHASEKKTLEYDKSFREVYKNFKNKGNVQFFLSNPELYETVFYHTDAYTQKFLRQYRDLLMNMEAIGITIKPLNKVYESEIRIKLNTDKQALSDVIAFESNTSKPYNEMVENLEFKVDPQSMEIAEDSTGDVEIFYPDSTLWYEGSVKEGEPDNLWRCYYESGRLKNSVLYEKGEVNNYAIFYYDNERKTIHINTQFKDDKLVEDYREFFENGQLKVKIPYKDGKPEGKAKYYYPNGNVKISGKYKEGERNGKWEYYDQYGELIREIKY